MAIFFRFR